MTKETTEITEIKAPKGANEAEITSLKDKSVSLMGDIKEKTTPAVLSMIDSIGKDSQDKMKKSNDVMNQNVGSLLKDLDGKSPTAEKLMELSACMGELNPSSLRNAWWFGIIPAPIKKYAVNNFINKYKPMKDHVSTILDGLRHGYDEIIELNITMEHQYNGLTEAMKGIQSDVFLCQHTIERVEEFEKNMDTTDQLEVQKVNQAKNKLWRKVRDLKTKEQAVNQFFVSLEQTFVSNSLLSEQIESAITVGPMVMNNALQIQAGLAKQAKIQEGLEKFQDGLSDMMAQNAKATKMATEKAVELYNNPVLALDKMEEGFNDLMSAVNTANDAIANSTQSAMDTSARLQEMNDAFKPTVEAMRDQRENNGRLEGVDIDLPALDDKGGK